MKRNDIYKELIEITHLLSGSMPACIRLNRLIDAIDEDRHLNYDQFECMEDVVSKFNKLKREMDALESDIKWLKSGKFSKEDAEESCCHEWKSPEFPGFIKFTWNDGTVINGLYCAKCGSIKANLLRNMGTMPILEYSFKYNDIRYSKEKSKPKDNFKYNFKDTIIMGEHPLSPWYFK